MGVSPSPAPPAPQGACVAGWWDRTPVPRWNSSQVPAPLGAPVGGHTPHLLSDGHTALLTASRGSRPPTPHPGSGRPTGRLCGGAVEPPRSRIERLFDSEGNTCSMLHGSGGSPLSGNPNTCSVIEHLFAPNTCSPPGSTPACARTPAPLCGVCARVCNKAPLKRTHKASP